MATTSGALPLHGLSIVEVPSEECSEEEMIGCVFDVEATGLRPHMLRDPDARIHCLMAQEFTYEEATGITLGARREFYDVSLDVQGDEWEYMGRLDGVPAYLNDMSAICGHGIIDYDLPILRHHLAYKPKCQIVDSLVISRKNFPDRHGGHSVDSWGARLGMVKPKQNDWSEMNEDVRHRCREDVAIEMQLLQVVLQEMKEGVEKCQLM